MQGLAVASMIFKSCLFIRINKFLTGWLEGICFKTFSEVLF
jgi:hypothetical protein